MAELGAAARSLYVDVREAILGLRSPISPGIGLVGAIEDYGARFADAAKVGVSVVASPAARDTHLRPATEANVFRIVQESLTNVRKHAGAGRVVIRVEREKEDLHLQIADDGRGFPTAPGTDRDWPRYGQAAMRERAAAIGARIAWSNGVDGGAVVTLDVPIASPAAAVAS
jgi:signal transduction histidine kinase